MFRCCDECGIMLEPGYNDDEFEDRNLCAVCKNKLHSDTQKETDDEA